MHLGTKQKGDKMPTIYTHTSKAITADQSDLLKAKFGEAIALIPGKSEAWLMTLFNGATNIYFKGNQDDDTALIEVGIKGKAQRADFEKLGTALSRAVEEVLEIPSDRIYISFSEFENYMWNGMML
jgi:hypothetical protein